MKQPPKPPIHREHVFGGSTTDPHVQMGKLDSMGSRPEAKGERSMVGKDSLRAACKAIPKD